MHAHSLHHHHTLFAFQKSLRGLFWSALLHHSGISIIGVFSLIFVYRIGSTLSTISLDPMRAGMLMVIGYILIIRVTVLFLLYPLAHRVLSIGLPKAAILGNLSMAMKFFFFSLATVSPVFLILGAVCTALEICLYLPAYNAMFAQRATIHEMGRDVAVQQSLFQVIHAVTPAVVGVLIVTSGFIPAFVLTVVFLLLANIPLMTLKNSHSMGSFNDRSIEAFHFISRPRVSLALCGRYTAEIALELWPIYVLLLLGGIDKVGLVVTIGLVLTIFFSLLSGWYFDHSKGRRLFIMNAFLLSMTWVVRIFSTTVFGVIAIEFSEKVLSSVFNPSFDALLLTASKRYDSYAFQVYREKLLSIFAIGIWLGIAILFWWSTTPWFWLFTLGAIGSLISIFLYTATTKE